MKTINRKDITSEEYEEYREILDKEKHHDHEIIEDADGVYRWKANPDVCSLIMLDRVDLNDLCPLLTMLGYGKNSEVYRKLYRDMGYSLFGYWEIFYWETNNPDADLYIPQP